MPRAGRELIILAHKDVPDHVMRQAENLAHAAAMTVPEYRMGVLPAIYQGRPVHVLSRVWQDPTHPDQCATEPLALLFTPEDQQALTFPDAEATHKDPGAIAEHLPQEPLDMAQFDRLSKQVDEALGPRDLGQMMQTMSHDDFERELGAIFNRILNTPPQDKENE